MTKKELLQLLIENDVPVLNIDRGDFAFLNEAITHYKDPDRDVVFTQIDENFKFFPKDELVTKISLTIELNTKGYTLFYNFGYNINKKIFISNWFLNYTKEGKTINIVKPCDAGKSEQEGKLKSLVRMLHDQDGPVKKNKKPIPSSINDKTSCPPEQGEIRVDDFAIYVFFNGIWRRSLLSIF